MRKMEKDCTHTVALHPPFLCCFIETGKEFKHSSTPWGAVHIATYRYLHVEICGADGDGDGDRGGEGESC